MGRKLPFNIDRAARDYVAAVPRKGPDGKRRGGNADAQRRILAALERPGDDRQEMTNLLTLMIAIADVAAEALDALESLNRGRDG